MISKYNKFFKEKQMRDILNLLDSVATQETTNQIVVLEADLDSQVPDQPDVVTCLLYTSPSPRD